MITDFVSIFKNNNILLYIIPSIVCLISFGDYIKEKKIKKYILIVICLILVFITTTRSTSLNIFYGHDTNSYINFFNNLGRGDTSKFEIGYVAINIIIKFFTNNYRYVFCVMSLMTMYFLYKYIRYYTDNEFICILAYVCIFYYLRDIGQMRAALAYSICIYSTIYLIEEKNKKFLIYILLATTIHFSSIFMLTLYPMYKLKLSRKSLTILLIISLVLFGFEWLDFIRDIAYRLPESKYTISLINYTSNSRARGIDSKVMLYMLISIVGIYIKDNDNIKSLKYDINIYSLVLGMFIAGVFNGSEVISVRLSELFITSIIVVISRFKDIANNERIEVIYHVLTCLFFIVYNFFLISSLTEYGL